MSKPYRIRVYVKCIDGMFGVGYPLFLMSAGPFWFLDFFGTKVAMKIGVDFFIIT